MAAPESNSTVILATARAQADAILSGYQAGREKTTNKAVAAHLAAVIEPLTRAVAALSEAVAASVGHAAKCRPAPPLAGEDSALSDGRGQSQSDAVASL